MVLPPPVMTLGVGPGGGRRAGGVLATVVGLSEPPVKATTMTMAMRTTTPMSPPITCFAPALESRLPQMVRPKLSFHHDEPPIKSSPPGSGGLDRGSAISAGGAEVGSAKVGGGAAVSMSEDWKSAMRAGLRSLASPRGEVFPTDPPPLRHFLLRPRTTSCRSRVLAAC